MKLIAAALLGFLVFGTSYAATGATSGRGAENTVAVATRATDNANARTTATTLPTTGRSAVVQPRTEPAATQAAVSARSATYQGLASTSGGTRARTATTVRSRADTGTGIADSLRDSLNAATRAGAGQARTAVAGPLSAGAARAATDAPTGDNSAITQTRVGAEYDRCKSAYFACMDQFCAMKNVNFQRCSCSDRVKGLTDQQTVIQEAANQLKAFTENLDTVGMTAAQAAAMKRAAEGENALTADASASKALLQAIMNSIRGGDTNVGGKFTELNSISINFDTAAAFGINDMGQAIAANNGADLYTAIYGQCRAAVRADCTDATLQRAVTAYLMAVEQDCNTVSAAMTANQKTLTAAVREGGAMLDLARVENRQNHNASDMTQCLTAVENAITSEEVCGPNYRKCLDNGQFIDITSGRPIAGVIDFWKLENLLTFNSNSSALTDQRLSKIMENKGFAANFAARTKKFAAPALDKCVEKADQVWADYLDKALLDIYYAQREKVAEIRRGCIDWIAACYTNGDRALTDSMAGLLNDRVTVTPDFIAVSDAMCKDYVESCNGMFLNDKSENIIQDYIDTKTQTDTIAACRAVAQQCFDKFGGTDFVNFYNRSSGLFAPGNALTWFTLYDLDQTFAPNAPTCGTQIDDDPCPALTAAAREHPVYSSPCAQQLAQIDSCKSPEIMKQVFGGFDSLKCDDTVCDDGITVKGANRFGIMFNESGINNMFSIRNNRDIGVATEVYNKIIDTLSNQCSNDYGMFREWRYITPGNYNHGDPCVSKFSTSTLYQSIMDIFGITDGENMCPRYYAETVDTKSWGACLCWENGGRRSGDGKNIRCDSASGNYNSAGRACPFARGTNGVLFFCCAAGQTNCTTDIDEMLLVPEARK
ncbi:hypothetical protein FACS189421_08540 [Bacteroidia bacterium]|nr:hypothetical protein FACS189421_08540 [Bacteroidia bacterium]